jgi:thiamine-monophosphate kinase
MRVKKLGEFGFIKRISAILGKTERPIVVGIGDDAAVVYSSGEKLQIVTTDMLVEDIHFRRSTAKPFQIGWKSLAANISDIAAMGGEPTYAFVSIGIPREIDVEFMDDLYSGMASIAKNYSVDIIGGDTVSSPQLIINIALLGEVEKENIIRRSGAKVGDEILVTGDLGGADAGLAILEQNLSMEDTEKHLTPIPRVYEGRLLAKSGYVSSMIDISDGLASETHHICEMSETGAEIYLDKIPLSANIPTVSDRIGKSCYDFALYGGEDYELLFTCKPSGVSILREEMLRNCDTQITSIGRIVDKINSITVVDKSGKRSALSASGYNHFIKSDG